MARGYVGGTGFNARTLRTTSNVTRGKVGGVGHNTHTHCENNKHSPCGTVGGTGINPNTRGDAGGAGLNTLSGPIWLSGAGLNALVSAPFTTKL